jgi:hypothetical protein
VRLRAFGNSATEFAAQLKAAVAPAFTRIGLSLETVTLQNVSLPEAQSLTCGQCNLPGRQRGRLELGETADRRAFRVQSVHGRAGDRHKKSDHRGRFLGGFIRVSSDERTMPGADLTAA